LVSDAGTPAISDPGYRLVRLCRERGIHVVAIPGANAAITALSASGLPSDQFIFVGFLPPRKSARREHLETLRNFRGTLIFYEGPHRIQATLEDIHDIFGDREACIGRELTKLHEEYLFGKVSELQPRIKKLGEFVVVIGGCTGTDDPALPELTREGVLKTLGISRNQLYDLFFKK
jgi:16S rRNA (cytidine1402-2'-O)-methyltransferase